MGYMGNYTRKLRKSVSGAGDGAGEPDLLARSFPALNHWFRCIES
jgi:hypothetical protein